MPSTHDFEKDPYDRSSVLVIRSDHMGDGSTVRLKHNYSEGHRHQADRYFLEITDETDLSVVIALDDDAMVALFKHYITLNGECEAENAD